MTFVASSCAEGAVVLGSELGREGTNQCSGIHERQCIGLCDRAMACANNNRGATMLWFRWCVAGRSLKPPGADCYGLTVHTSTCRRPALPKATLLLLLLLCLVCSQGSLPQPGKAFFRACPRERDMGRGRYGEGRRGETHKYRPDPA